MDKTEEKIVLEVLSALSEALELIDGMLYNTNRKMDQYEYMDRELRLKQEIKTIKNAIKEATSRRSDAQE